MTADPLDPAKAAELRASFARQGFMRVFGAVMTVAAAGRCEIEMPFSDAAGQQNGFFHGGVVGALADTAGGYAAMTVLPAGADVLTLEYKINFLRPAAGERLVAEGYVLRSGRSVSVVRADVHVIAAGRRLLCAALQQSVMRAPAPA